MGGGLGAAGGGAVRIDRVADRATVAAPAQDCRNWRVFSGYGCGDLSSRSLAGRWQPLNGSRAG